MTQIKTKERVKELAEVFTAEREVNDMLDLMNPHFQELASTFLEPACGNGNFLIAILERKLLLTKNNPLYQTAFALTTIYGIDISQENVDEAKQRLFQAAKLHLQKEGISFPVAYEQVLLKILNTNILLGNTIDNPEQIIFTSYKEVAPETWVLETYNLKNLLENKASPIEVKPPILYNKI